MKTRLEMPSLFACYHCDPIQEFSGFEVWVRHQMEVHNISSEFYHPSATFLAHMSRYVNGNVGVRYDSRPGDLYNSSSFRPRSAVLPPDVRGSL